LLLANVAEDLFRSVLQGVPPGAVFALIALGFVLTYKTSGVFNLAFGAQAYISAAMYFQAVNEWGWHRVPAVILAVFVLAPAIGLILERFIFRGLRTASSVAKLVVAIGLTVAMPPLFELGPAVMAAAVVVVPLLWFVLERTLFPRVDVAAGTAAGTIRVVNTVLVLVAAAGLVTLVAELEGLGIVLKAIVASVGVVLAISVYRHADLGATTRTVTAIVIGAVLVALLAEAPEFETVAGSTPVGLVPDGAGVFYDPFGVYPWSRDELAQMAVAVLAMVGLAAVFRYSAIGLAMRAVVESPRMTELAGIQADRVSAFAWALSSLFAGLAGVLIAPRFNTLDDVAFFELVVVAIAAAAIGRLTSLPWALAGGIGLGVVISVGNTFLPRWADDISWLEPIADDFGVAVPFLVLFVILVFTPSIRRSTETTDPLSGVDPPPPASAAVTRSHTLTVATRVFAVVFFTVLGWWVFFSADASWLFLVTQAVIMSTIFLSITVITGFAGQISLCQATFAAIGGFTMYQLADRWDVSVLVGALLGGLVAAAVGALLSLPVRRLGGVWLAIATLAFAFFFDAVMVKFTWIGPTSLLQGARVPRPELGPIDFGDDTSFLVLALIVFAITALAVIQLREGTVGRTLRALRGSELAAQSIGINPSRARMIAFAVSAFIAALGGAMLSMQQGNVNYQQNFSPFVGLFWLVLVVTISARTVEGAANAGAAFGLMERVLLRNVLHLSGKWRFIFFGLTSVQFARHPEGLLEFGKRRSITAIDAKLAEWRARRDGTDGADDSEPAPTDHAGAEEAVR